MRWRAILIVPLVSMLFWATVGASRAAAMRPLAGRLVPAATLSSSDQFGPLLFGDLAISGPLIVASGYSSSEGYVNPRAFVFAEGTHGWRSERPAAQLVSSVGQVTGPYAVSGEDVFAAGTMPDGSGAIYVFTEPAGGWSGTVNDTARLATSSPVPTGPFAPPFGSSLASSGQTVVASGGGRVFVFTEPRGGWSGTVYESADLAASDGTSLGDVAVSGGTVVGGGAGDARRAYVFREPAGGWKGTVAEAAMLTGTSEKPVGASRVAVSGSTILTAGPFHELDVFSEPQHGWSGVLHPRDVLSFQAPEDAQEPDVAIAGSTALMLSLWPLSSHQCPCSDALFLLDVPPHGLPAATVLTKPESGEYESPIAIAGNWLAIAAYYGVHVFKVLARPTAERVRLTGLAADKPRISFRLLSSLDRPGIRAVKLWLPRGLRVTANNSAVAAGISIAGHPRYTVTRGRRSLTLTFARAQRVIALKLGPDAIIESASLLRQIRKIVAYNRTHEQKITRLMTTELFVTDAARYVTRIALRIKVP